ncbi:hypothetical protein MMC20_006800 [Loxospora ochrophaea]|nr:hypothetical protein [Loxospora ochrophaea]
MPKGYDSQRSIDGRRYSGEENVRNPNVHHREPRNGHRYNQKPPPPSFENALVNLHEAILTALEFYHNFKSHFDNEVQGIAAYAGSRTIGNLWERKVAYNNKQPNDVERRGSRPQLSFIDLYLELRDNFNLVMDAASRRRPRHSSSRDPGIDKETHERLAVKVGGAASDILKLTETITTNIKDFHALTTELELLATYLDKCEGLWSRGRETKPNHMNDFNESGQQEQFIPQSGDEPGEGYDE